ncbi:methyltransferase domain-containing protein [Streptomyces marincola]|uniref:methyltransferase domain-containing protein n=1 Tax=Streptomyces marincola TaxID=2878388 RepID=UPI001CF5F873|nr:methyltransferase domain-containing protein [Streptomyces marincola]UCM88529.1 methyltransferase domain-containing protein [Streptomyces marincola]
MPPPPDPAPPTRWDPAQYERHRAYRARPLRDLLARVPPLPAAPRVADLGCGPGRPSLLLTERWPDARVTGYDNSPAMLAEAARHAGPVPGGSGSLAFEAADLADWRPTEPFDLIASNAALQWVPGHVGRFPDWLAGLAPGGALAFQVPGNASAPSHVLLRELAEGPRWRGRLRGVLHANPVLSPAGYFEALAALGAEPEVWETAYLQVLAGEDAVLDWVKGTSLRPVLTALDDDPEASEAFVGEYRAALAAAYPRGPHGTLFPFRRVFVVARVPGGAR